MIVYIFVAVWPLIIQWLYHHRRLAWGRKRLNGNMHLLIAMLPIFVILAFRAGNMGADTGTYMKHFTKMVDMSLEKEFAVSRMEHGYLIFVKLITYVTHSPLMYQVICISCVMFCMYDFLKRQDVDDAFRFLFFYVTLGLFTFMFTGVRQCLAMAICWYSYKFVMEKKYVRFAACIALAFMFHKSSVLFLCVPFIASRKVSQGNTLLYLLAAVIGGRYLDQIQNWFGSALDYNYTIESAGGGLIYLLVLSIFTVFCLVMIYNTDGSLRKNRNQTVLINLNFITLLFWVMRLQTRTAERPSLYFLFFTCMMISIGVGKIPKNRDRQWYNIAVYGCSLLLYIYRMSTNFASLVPYAFYS